MDDNLPKRSPYFTMSKAGPPAKKPLTVNLDNPLNPAINSYTSTALSRYEATAFKEPAVTMIDANLLPSSIRRYTTGDMVTAALQTSSMPVTQRTAAVESNPSVPNQDTSAPSGALPPARRLQKYIERSQQATSRRNASSFRNSSPTSKPRKPVLESRKRDRTAAEFSSDVSVNSDADFSSDTQKRASNVKKSRKEKSRSQSSANVDPLMGQTASAKQQEPKRARGQKRIQLSDSDYMSSPDAADEAVGPSEDPATSSFKQIPAQPTNSRRRSAAKSATKPLTAEEEAARQKRNKAKNASRPPAGSHLGLKEDGTPQFKIQGTPYPATWEDAGEADRMLVSWRAQRKNWKDVRNEWVRITGTLPGYSTLSVRHMKLKEIMGAGHNAHDMLLIQATDETEKEIKKEFWQRVAAKMKAAGGAEHGPANLQKRYEALERNGFDLSSNGAAKKQVKSNDANYEEVDADGYTAIDRNLAGLDDYDDEKYVEEAEDTEKDSDGATQVEEDVQDAISKSLMSQKKQMPKASLFSLGDNKEEAIGMSLLDYGSSDDEDE